MRISLIIILSVLLQSCSKEEVTPLIEKDYSINSGHWVHTNTYHNFIVNDKSVRDIKWGYFNDEELTHNHSFEFFGDSLKIMYRSTNGVDVYNNLDFILSWKDGQKVAMGYQQFPTLPEARIEAIFIKQ